MTKKNIGKIIFASLIIVLGIVVCAMGIGEKFIFSYNYTSYLNYGGDAYTGIQHAGADAANGANKVGNLIEEALNFSCIIGGVLIALLGAYLLFAALPDKNTVITKQSASSAETSIADLPEL